MSPALKMAVEDWLDARRVLLARDEERRRVFADDFGVPWDAESEVRCSARCRAFDAYLRAMVALQPLEQRIDFLLRGPDA